MLRGGRGGSSTFWTKNKREDSPVLDSWCKHRQRDEIVWGQKCLNNSVCLIPPLYLLSCSRVGVCLCVCVICEVGMWNLIWAVSGGWGWVSFGELPLCVATSHRVYDFCWDREVLAVTQLCQQLSYLYFCFDLLCLSLSPYDSECPIYFVKHYVCTEDNLLSNPSKNQPVQ